MNELLSPRRLRLLIRADIVTGYRSLLVVCGSVAGLLLVTSMITRGDFFLGDVFYRECFGVVLFVWGIVASSRAFGPLHDKARNESFLLVPASALEKTLARLLAVTAGLVVLLLVLVGIASHVIESLNLLLFGTRNAFFDPADPEVRERILVYLGLQPFYFLGAAWFRRAHFIKTTLALSLAFVALTAFTAATFRVVFAGFELDMHLGLELDRRGLHFAHELFHRSLGNVEALAFAIALALACACWCVAWLRVREAQVSDGV